MKKLIFLPLTLMVIATPLATVVSCTKTPKLEIPEKQLTEIKAIYNLSTIDVDDITEAFKNFYNEAFVDVNRKIFTFKIESMKFNMDARIGIIKSEKEGLVRYRQIIANFVQSIGFMSCDVGIIYNNYDTKYSFDNFDITELFTISDIKNASTENTSKLKDATIQFDNQIKTYHHNIYKIFVSSDEYQQWYNDNVVVPNVDTTDRYLAKYTTSNLSVEPVKTYTLSLMPTDEEIDEYLDIVYGKIK